jgi:hypothetical protein
MDELLAALKSGNQDLVCALANDLLITRSGQINMVEKSKFESYAPCHIYAGEKDSFGWLTGIIDYNGTKFMFG